MIAVIATVGSEVEGDRKALLTRRKVSAVESVRFLRRGEAGILAYRPRLLHIHRRVGATDKRSRARICIKEGQALEVGLTVEPLDADSFRRQPLVGAYFTFPGLGFGPGDRLEVRNHA